MVLPSDRYFWESMWHCLTMWCFEFWYQQEAAEWRRIQRQRRRSGGSRADKRLMELSGGKVGKDRGWWGWWGGWRLDLQMPGWRARKSWVGAAFLSADGRLTKQTTKTVAWIVVWMDENKVEQSGSSKETQSMKRNNQCDEEGIISDGVFHRGDSINMFKKLFHLFNYHFSILYGMTLVNSIEIHIF